MTQKSKRGALNRGGRRVTLKPSPTTTSARFRRDGRTSQQAPLVTPWGNRTPEEQIADAQEGKRFLLQGGDCAESFNNCRAPIIWKIASRFSSRCHSCSFTAGSATVIRVGRFAGQYCSKYQSSTVEVQSGVELPSYFGDLVNRPEFTPEARRADPQLLLRGYEHAALTLNFIRSLSAGGFADLHHPEYWDLSFLERADVDGRLRAQYLHMSRRLEGPTFHEGLEPDDHRRK